MYENTKEKAKELHWQRSKTRKSLQFPGDTKHTHICAPLSLSLSLLPTHSHHQSARESVENRERESESQKEPRNNQEKKVVTRPGLLKVQARGTPPAGIVDRWSAPDQSSGRGCCSSSIKTTRRASLLSAVARACSLRAFRFMDFAYNTHTLARELRGRHLRG